MTGCLEKNLSPAKHVALLLFRFCNNMVDHKGSDELALSLLECAIGAVYLAQDYSDKRGI